MADFDTRMAALRGRFVAQAADEARALAEHAQNGRWQEVRDICHGLAGRSGMFGFAALGDAAREVEEAIDGRARPSRVQPLLDDLLAAMRGLPQA